MRERISLGGVSVVGFGDASDAKSSDPSLAASLVGFSIGGLAGAAIGAMVGKGKGAAVGALIGGIGGGVITYATTAKAATMLAASNWKKLSQGDPLKEGQTIAVSVLLPNGVAVPPEVAATISTWIAFQQSRDAQPGWVSRQFAVYPPGTSTPSDWPADDNLGSGAYRFSLVSPISDPYDPSEVTKIIPVPLAVTAWAKL